MSWLSYFPFAAGERLVFQAKMGFMVSLEGTAEVKACSDTLELTFFVPEQTVLLKTLPETQGSLTLVYRQEGVGNTGSSIVNGKSRDSLGLAIRSSPDTAERHLRLAPDAQGRAFGFTLQRVCEAEARLKDFSGVPSLLRGLSISLRRA